MSEDLPIDLVPSRDVRTPRLPGTVVLRSDPDGLIDALLADLLIHARNCVRAFGDFHLAISATEQVEPYLRRLMYDPNHRDFPWMRTRVWMVDEIGVGLENPESRYSRLRDLVLEQSGIPKEQLHRIEPTAEGAAAYEADLRQHLGWREKGHDRLDFVMLTLGDRGGVAGFEEPLEPAGGQGRLVTLVDQARPGPPRVSMTLEFINASRVVAVISGGETSRGTLAGVVAGAKAMRTGAKPDSPALRLAPLAGELRWYLDQSACEAREP